MSQTIHRQALRITLLDDCVFSERNATEGGHRSLSHIPGQTLLGAAAARLYGKFPGRGDDAYTAFHSGRVRFLDGLPADGTEIAYPVPLSWHRAKSGGDPNTAHNFAVGKPELPGGEQPKQLREGFLFPDGRHVEPARTLRMKTAIDPKTGHAAEAQLFGYESLSRGQSFIAWIEADAEASHLLKDIVKALEGDCLLGRSRSAEYGRVHIEKADAAKPVEHGAVNGTTLTLWLLSDLALTGADHRPSVQVTAKALGLDGDIDWGHTFLRHRRYAPWNAHRRGYDRERVLLSAGGVITVKLKQPATTAQIERLKTGIGLYRESGLGRVWINPPLLVAATHPLTKQAITAPPKSGGSNDPLIAWLKDQTTDWRTEQDECAKQLRTNIEQQLRAARRRQGIREGVDFGPSKSQWGRVFETARTRSGQPLFAALFDGDSAVIKPSGEGWSEIVAYENGQPVRLATSLRTLLGRGDTPDTHYAYLIRRLAHLMRGDTRRKGSQKGAQAHV